MSNSCLTNEESEASSTVDLDTHLSTGNDGKSGNEAGMENESEAEVSVNESVFDSSGSVPDETECRKAFAAVSLDKSNAPSSTVSYKVYFGDITEAQTEAIAMVSDFQLKMSSTVIGKQMKKKAGKDFEKQCKELQEEKKKQGSYPPFKLYDVVHTCAGGKLSPDVKYIIHTFLPRYSKRVSTTYEFCLSDVYYSIFKYANKLELLSLTMPILGTGKVGVPLKVSITAFLSGFKSFQTCHGPRNLHDIRVVNNSTDIIQQVETFLKTGMESDSNERSSFAGAGCFHYGRRRTHSERCIEINSTLGVQFFTGDISSVSCDAIAMLTNRDLLHIAGIAKVIKNKAGPLFERDCEKIRKSKGGQSLEVGEVVHARAGDLCPGIKTIIMTVMEKFDTNALGDEQRLSMIELYKRILLYAHKEGISVIGMTLLGIGAADIPHTVCVAALHKAVTAFSECNEGNDKVKKIIIVNNEEEITNKCYQLFVELKAFGEEDVLGFGF